MHRRFVATAATQLAALLGQAEAVAATHLGSAMQVVQQPVVEVTLPSPNSCSAAVSGSRASSLPGENWQPG